MRLFLLPNPFSIEASFLRAKVVNHLLTFSPLVRFLKTWIVLLPPLCRKVLLCFPVFPSSPSLVRKAFSNFISGDRR